MMSAWAQVNNPQYNPAARNTAPISGNVQQNSAGANQGPIGENVLIILDASYSMGESLPGGEPKMMAAKRVILDVIRSLPPNSRVGLRVYGQSSNSFNACRATQLLVPIGSGNRNVMSSSLIGIRPTGATPITHAIRTAVSQDFVNLPPGKKTIILVSDGMETCDADPCDTAVQMMRGGVNVKINVVGFGLKDLDATRQMRCVAASTFGKYYSANTAAELANSLRNSMNVQTEVQGQIILPGANNPGTHSSAPSGAKGSPPAGR